MRSSYGKEMEGALSDAKEIEGGSSHRVEVCVWRNF